LPLAGEYTPKLPAGDPGTGSILVRAVYTDQGHEVAPPLTGERVRLLRSPVLPVTAAAVKEGVEPAERGAGQVHSGSVVAFRQVDLTGVRQVEVVARDLRIFTSLACPGFALAVLWVRGQFQQSYAQAINFHETPLSRQAAVQRFRACPAACCDRALRPGRRGPPRRCDRGREEGLALPPTPLVSINLFLIFQ
jgi:hypothetical protein